MLPGLPSLLSGGGDAIAQRRNLSLHLGLAFFFLSKHSLPILILMSRFDSSDEKLKWWRRFLSRLDESYDDKRELKTKLKFIKTVILYQTTN